MNRVNKLCLLFFFSSLLFKELHATIIIFPSNEDETLRLAGNGTQSKFLAVPNNTSLYSLINKNGTFQEISNIPFDIYIKPSIWNVIQGFYKDQSMKVEDTKWIASVENELLQMLKKLAPNERIAFLTQQPHSSCMRNTMNRMVDKIRQQQMHSMVFYLDQDVLEGFTNDLQLWYSIQRAVELEMTVFVLILPRKYSMRVIEFIPVTGLDSLGFSWVTIGLTPKDLQLLKKRPVNFNNIGIQRTLKTEQVKKILNGQYDVLPGMSEKYFDHHLNHYVHWKKPEKITPPKYSLRFATKFYTPLVFELRHIPNEAGHCEVGLPCRKPIKSLNGTLVSWAPVCCSGLILEILQDVIKDMSIVYDLYAVVDGTFGGFQNGKWTGIINDVYTGKADIGVQAMTQLRQRLDFVDFTEPILGSWFGIIRRQEKPHLPPINWIFLSKLHLDLIISIVVVFVVIFSFSLACENLIARILQLNRFQTRDMFSYISGLLFQRDLGAKLPKFWSSRLPCIGYAVAMTVIMSTYTANLTATNLVQEENKDFKGLSDEKITNPSDNFKFTLMQQTSYELWSRKKPHIYQHLKDRMVPSDYVGLQNVLSGKLDGYISDWTFLKYLSQLPQFCSKLKLYKEKRKSIFSAFIVPKNSPWKDAFSQEILNVFESQKMKELLKRWLWYAKCGTAENDAGAFTWRYFGGLFIFTGGSVGFVLIILLLENIVHCCRKK